MAEGVQSLAGLLLRNLNPYDRLRKAELFTTSSDRGVESFSSPLKRISIVQSYSVYSPSMVMKAGTLNPKP